VVLGTAHYLSPEQALGQTADARSDIYSLGCLLYEMLTGQPPFMADVPAAVMNQHVNAAVTPPRAVNPSVPPALDTLVVQMLAKSPDDRPQTAAEVRDRLDQALVEPASAGGAADEAITTMATAATVPLVGIVPEAAPVPEEEEQPAEEVTRAQTTPQRAIPRQTRAATVPASAPPARRRTGRGFWTVLAMLAVLLLGGAVALALTGGGSGHSASTTGRSSSPATSSPTTSQSVSTSTSGSTSTRTVTSTHTVTTKPASTSTSTSATTPATSTTTPPSSTPTTTSGPASGTSTAP
jgi:eukaryotic-like serine/threonine-protein kinase